MEEEEHDVVLESVAETFESAGARANVDAEEMFVQLLEKVESSLGQVWLDGVSVSGEAGLPTHAYLCDA